MKEKNNNNIKYLEGVLGDCLFHSKIEKDFLNKTQKYTKHKGIKKTDKFKYTKKLEFYSLKAITKRLKKQVTLWEKIFCAHKMESSNHIKQ